MNTKTGVAQWADKSANIQTGCRNGCLYCYAQAMAQRFKRIAGRETWLYPSLNKPGKFPRDSRVMFPTTHDITLDNIHRIVDATGAMLDRGNTILFVTKAGPTPIDLLLYYLDQFPHSRKSIEFRFSITTLNYKTQRFWEPDAPHIIDRIEAMKDANCAGFRVSVSCEPMLFKDEAEILPHFQAMILAGASEVWYGYLKNARARIAQNIQDQWHKDLALDRLLCVITPANVGRLLRHLPLDPRVMLKDSVITAINKTTKRNQYSAKGGPRK